MLTCACHAEGAPLNVFITAISCHEFEVCGNSIIKWFCDEVSCRDEFGWSAIQLIYPGRQAFFLSPASSNVVCYAFWLRY